jgi:hypothetical protein
VILEFTGEVIYWRGPAPFLFVPVPIEMSAEIKAVSRFVTYGWGVIPATVEIGKTKFTTSLFPKGELYLVPVKVAVQRAEGVKEADLISVRLEVGSK